MSEDSSPLCAPDSVISYVTYTPDEQSTMSSDEIMPVIANVTSVDPSQTTNPSKCRRTSLVVYGPICIRKRHVPGPTLATGRRSKDTIVVGEDAAKREIRRLKNRESARNLKKIRDNIEHQLQEQVKKLEGEEQKLFTEVKTLETYKQYLQEKCQQINPIYKIIARTASAVLAEIKKQQMSQEVLIHTQPKDEPRSPSPQWQLMFHI